MWEPGDQGLGDEGVGAGKQLGGRKIVKGEILPAGNCINIRSIAIRMYFDRFLFYKL